MSEEVFHFAIVNPIKVKVKQQISVALRPTQAGAGEKANIGGRQIDATFDVEYETGEAGKDLRRRVLFRIGIRLMKLPTQATSQTINQIIDCLETYLSQRDDHDNWTPTIQGRIVHIEWDQKAKPTPLLVLEQSKDGGVLFKTQRASLNSPSPSPSPRQSSRSSEKTPASKRSGTKKRSTKASKVKK
jgi:hypothetical protein